VTNDLAVFLVDFLGWSNCSGHRRRQLINRQRLRKPGRSYHNRFTRALSLTRGGRDGQGETDCAEQTRGNLRASHSTAVLTSDYRGFQKADFWRLFPDWSLLGSRLVVPKSRWKVEPKIPRSQEAAVWPREQLGQRRINIKRSTFAFPASAGRAVARREDGTSGHQSDGR
jgi:hypothetical protein